MHIEADGTVVFSTGRKRDANNGIIGLAPDLTVSGGYDQPFFAPLQEWMNEEDGYPLTPAERIELADYMLAQWQAFKDRAQAETVGAKTPG